MSKPKKSPVKVIPVARICMRCTHQWYSRGPHKPKACPKCKQYTWDTPPTRRA
jgi:hypothetical protein